MGCVFSVLHLLLESGSFVDRTSLHWRLKMIQRRIKGRTYPNSVQVEIGLGKSKSDWDVWTMSHTLMGLHSKWANFSNWKLSCSCSTKLVMIFYFLTIKWIIVLALVWKAIKMDCCLTFLSIYHTTFVSQSKSEFSR